MNGGCCSSFRDSAGRRHGAGWWIEVEAPEAVVLVGMGREVNTAEEEETLRLSKGEARHPGCCRLAVDGCTARTWAVPELVMLVD